MRLRGLMTGLALSALTMPAIGAAQELTAELKQLDEQLPGTLVNDPSRLDWPVQGTGFKSKGVQDASIPGGGAALQLDIEAAGEQPYSIQSYVPLLSGFTKGDSYTVGFYARALSAETTDGKGLVGVRFQQNASPWPGFGEKQIHLGPQWEWHEVSGVSSVNAPREESVIALQLASAKQSIQIGQTIVVKGASAIAGAASAPAAEDPAAALAEQFELPAQLQGAGRLIDRPDFRGWGNTGPQGSFADLDDKTIWLGKATRFTVTEKGANRWDVGTSIPLSEGIDVGDKLLIAVAAKTVGAETADGKARVGVRVQSSEPPYQGFSDSVFAAGPNWQLIRIRMTATEAIAKGKATVALHFAEAPQVVDIGPVYVFKTY